MQADLLDFPARLAGQLTETSCVVSLEERRELSRVLELQPAAAICGAD